MIVFDTTPLLRPRFTEDGLTATQWESAADKAAFANDLCRFIAADFKQTLFTKKLYRRLSNCFGHIAHYDLAGFFVTFFADLNGKVAFLEQTLQWPCFGDPAWTYSDVERMVQRRLHACNLLEAYRMLLSAETERKEREALRYLREKYEREDASVAPQAILRTARLARSTPGHVPTGQQRLF